MTDQSTHQDIAAAVTMVRGDAFFLRHWVKYYGEQFGRASCYVVLHGDDPALRQIAEGCNIIVIPFASDPNFDMRRWRLLNNIVQGLLSYYRHVVVGDVDELVVMDPDQKPSLMDVLAATPGDQVLTPVGLEVLHILTQEKDPIDDVILGPRRFVKHVAAYSKPCILSAPVKLSRGGHFAKANRFHSPEGLYLFHLKHCDFDHYVDAMNRRNAFTASTETGFRKASVGRHWFEDFRGEDNEVFAAFDAMPEDAFDYTPIRTAMAETFEPRAESGFWHSKVRDDGKRRALPERFFGIF